MTVMQQSTQSTMNTDVRLLGLVDPDACFDAARDPAWLVERRRAAREQCASIGLPTRRSESWRQLPVKPLATMAAARIGSADPAAEVVLGVPGLEGHRLVFLDGRFSPERSSVAETSGDVFVGRLTDGPAVAERWLGTVQGGIRAAGPHAPQAPRAVTEDDPFPAMNLACFDECVVVHVPADVKLERPVEIVWASTAASAAGEGEGEVRPVSFPRVLVVAERGAEVTVIEDFVGAGPSGSLVVGVTELVAGDDARIEHVALDRERSDAVCLRDVAIRQGAGSTVRTHGVLTGAGFSRHAIEPLIAGSGAFCVMNGLYVGRGQQHQDVHIRVRHAEPGCESRQFFRGILEDRAAGTFTGRIMVDRKAQRTDAIQSNQSLLLSDRARAHTRPQLEIYADDVTCTHGATVGQIDPTAISYLRARGLPADLARSMMIYAAASEEIERIGVPEARAVVLRELLDRLPAGDALSRVLD